MTEVTWETIPLILLTIATAALGVARLSRAVTYDKFPPFAWWRTKWMQWTDRGSDWPLLFSCWWCLSFWVAAVCVGWYVASWHVLWLAWAWWIFWGTFALAYLAPMIIVRDGDED